MVICAPRMWQQQLHQTMRTLENIQRKNISVTVAYEQGGTENPVGLSYADNVYCNKIATIHKKIFNNKHLPKSELIFTKKDINVVLSRLKLYSFEHT